jgi:hypothetical protein
MRAYILGSAGRRRGNGGLAEPPSWDLIDEDWEDISDWTNVEQGVKVIEESPSGQLHVKAGDSGGLDSFAEKKKEWPIQNVPDFTTELRVKFDQLGAYAGEISDGFVVEMKNGTNRFNIFVFTDQIRYFNNSDSWVTFVADAISTGEWYTYRVICDSPGTMKIYRGTTMLATKTDIMATGADNGRVKVGVRNYSPSPAVTEAHLEYFKIATGLYEE